MVITQHVSNESTLDSNPRSSLLILFITFFLTNLILSSFPSPSNVYPNILLKSLYNQTKNNTSLRSLEYQNDGYYHHTFPNQSYIIITDFKMNNQTTYIPNQELVWSDGNNIDLSWNLNYNYTRKCRNDIKSLLYWYITLSSSYGVHYSHPLEILHCNYNGSNHYSHTENIVINHSDSYSLILSSTSQNITKNDKEISQLPQSHRIKLANFVIEFTEYRSQSSFPFILALGMMVLAASFLYGYYHQNNLNTISTGRGYSNYPGQRSTIAQRYQSTDNTTTDVENDPDLRSAIVLSCLLTQTVTQTGLAPFSKDSKFHSNMKEDSIIHWDNSLTSCPICLDVYQIGDEVCWSRNKQCGHAFHLQCMREWLQNHEDCPMCRFWYLGDKNGDCKV